MSTFPSQTGLNDFPGQSEEFFSNTPWIQIQLHLTGNLWLSELGRASVRFVYTFTRLRWYYVLKKKTFSKKMVNAFRRNQKIHTKFNQIYLKWDHMWGTFLSNAWVLRVWSIPTSLKNASKTTQGVAVRCNQSSIRLHIAMKCTTYSTIIIHPSYYQFASPEYPKCHRHSIWVVCSSPTKMSKHWDHGNDGWEWCHCHHFGSCNFLVLKLLNDPEVLKFDYLSLTT